ncbi:MULTISPECIES: FadR/GntR family transcriptional regulator [unclassified Aurantimonas]|uniref:FadR/GntR family transcriptional regulator n=1 Tax=unclassified Aurantimonas TaxID=2638230 RepID=UPI002E177557|nr:MULTISPECIES: FadR/GntR family transcriptional regulator [unclassified Aurantimonas]MEC5293485.1 FadR/GntR family transcriptional regulator [Aurantimonas sp. C2-3-R2]MEC5414550.1 FadR/GntR family transcriptional regulator [Aurantimonas sp. C2-4-R8]
MSVSNVLAPAPFGASRRILAKEAYVPVSQHAVHTIQQMVKQRDMKPGDRLPSQRELSEALGLSRPSLREAISVLETLGIVRSEPGRGVFVCDQQHAAQVPGWRFGAQYSEEEVYQVRLCIEPEMTALAALRLDAGQLAELGALIDYMHQASQHDDLVKVAACDNAFHRLLCDACDNRMLAEVYHNMLAFVEESQRRPLIKTKSVWETIREHEEILKAVEQRNPQGAHRNMRQHLLGAASRMGIRLVIFFS